MLQWLCFQSGGYPDKTVDVIYSCHSASSPPSPVSMLSTTDTPDVFFSCPLGSMRSTLKRGKGGLMTVKNKLRARYSEQLHLLGYRRQCTTNTPSRPPHHTSSKTMALSISSIRLAAVMQLRVCGQRRPSPHFAQPFINSSSLAFVKDVERR